MVIIIREKVSLPLILWTQYNHFMFKIKAKSERIAMHADFK